MLRLLLRVAIEVAIVPVVFLVMYLFVLALGGIVTPSTTPPCYDALWRASHQGESIQQNWQTYHVGAKVPADISRASACD